MTLPAEPNRRMTIPRGGMMDRYIAQLDNSDAELRRAAIIALRDSGDPHAVEPLLKAALTDQDTSLRELARSAAYQIGTTQAQAPDAAQPSAQAQPAISGLTSATVIRPIQPPPRKVSPRDKRFARRQLNRAVELRIADLNDKASHALIEALRADPSMAYDQSLRNLATNVTGLPVEQAIKFLIEQGKDPNISLEEDRRPVFAITPEGTRLIADFLALFIVLLPLSLALLNLSNFLFSSTGGKINPLQTSFVVTNAMSTALGLVRTSVILLIAVTLGNLITFFVGQMMGGVGLLYPFMKVLIRLQIVIGLVLIALVLANAAVILASPATDRQFAAQTVGSLSVIGTIFANIFAHAFFVARAHRFEFNRGILTAVVSFALIAVFVAAASGALAELSWAAYVLVAVIAVFVAAYMGFFRR